MGGVEQHTHAASFEFSRQCLERHAKAGRAGDGVDHGQHRAVRDGAQHRFHDDVRALDGKRERNGDDLGAPTLGYEVNRVATGLIGVVGDKDFVAFGKHQ